MHFTIHQKYAIVGNDTSMQENSISIRYCFNIAAMLFLKVMTHKHGKFIRSEIRYIYCSIDVNEIDYENHKMIIKRKHCSSNIRDLIKCFYIFKKSHENLFHDNISGFVSVYLPREFQIFYLSIKYNLPSKVSMHLYLNNFKLLGLF